MKLKKGGYGIARDFLSRARGLMFRLRPVRILFKFDFPARHSIHSFFVFFPFDAIYLDGKMRVSEKFLSVKPFTLLVSPGKPALFLLELPEGEGKGLEIGEKIEI